MGLDWNPLSRPKPGHEAEYARIFDALEHGAPAKTLFGRATRKPLGAHEKEAHVQRFREISEAPFEALGAPRVGHDEAADAWLRSRLREGARFEEVRERMRGYRVLDLLPDCDGFPRYTHNGMYEGVDRYSFRGAFLDDVKDVIGEELHADAWNRKLAPELAAYADALEARALPWARSEGVAHLATQHSEAEFVEGSAETRADILFTAIRWCRYWSARGFGLDPYF
jgi:hypothetical protein